ncbi:MAG: hypothetical protein OXC06_11000 [Acidimicrobiaceae bacterium]|nr:hypothetical protein [Acidimicrobiaceae bacterium]
MRSPEDRMGRREFIPDRAIDDTVTPISISYFGYSLIALACQLWARSGASS